jgi:predicted ATPase
MLLALDPARAGEAEACFKRAIEVARRQSAKSFELRAATGLAELLRKQDRIQEARDLIAPICAWFDEGADTQDLRRGRDVQASLTGADGPQR